MKRIIYTIIGLFVTIPILFIGICVFPLYALFKSITSGYIFSKYLDKIEAITKFLFYPVKLYDDRVSERDMLVEKLHYYRNRYNEYMKMDGKKVDCNWKIKAIVEDLQEHTKVSVLTSEYLNEKLDEILKELNDEQSEATSQD